ncbi:MAG: TIM barrel protein [Deinococcota bacterium]
MREALASNQITAVMEIALPINEYGKTASGLTPVEVLEANLPAIRSLPCKYVHWHLAPLSLSPARPLEQDLLSQFKQGASIALENEFHFGFENNEPKLDFLSTPASCAALLAAVDNLGLVWDVNHTIPEHSKSFQDLIPKMTMLHISDTPLPEVNHHLPLGQGSINFSELLKELRRKNFQGPAILEIGGLPKSGGYGKDTDEALVDSLCILTMYSPK